MQHRLFSLAVLGIGAYFAGGIVYQDAQKGALVGVGWFYLTVKLLILIALCVGAYGMGRVIRWIEAPRHPKFWDDTPD